MKKITASARVIDIFNTESLESCAMLLELAQQLVKSRQSRNSVKPTRRTRASETFVATVTEPTAVATMTEPGQ